MHSFVFRLRNIQASAAWRGRVAGRSSFDQRKSRRRYVMSLGLDLMGEGTAQSDTAMGFVDNMADAPQLSSLVSERRVHHAPNSPNSTVVQGNPNAKANTQESESGYQSEPVESKSSFGAILGGIVMVLGIAGFSWYKVTNKLNPSRRTIHLSQLKSRRNHKASNLLWQKETTEQKESTGKCCHSNCRET